MTIKKFGELKAGDIILGADGKEAVVTEVYDTHIPDSMYEIELENGKTLKASGNHLWYVETDLDRSLHRHRLQSSKKVFKKELTQEMLDNLKSIATAEDEIETSLMDMTNLLEAYEKQEIINILQRVASSIGHISENKGTYEDLLTGEQMANPTDDVRHYDARIFSQQILSLTGKREYKKIYPVILGRVLTTEDLLDLYETVNIPVIESID